MCIEKTSVQKSFSNYCPNELEKVQVIRIYTRILFNLECVVISCAECEKSILRVENLFAKNTVPITSDSSIIPPNLTHKVNREGVAQIIITNWSKLQWAGIPKFLISIDHHQTFHQPTATPNQILLFFQMLPKPIPGSWNSVKLCKWVELFCSSFMRLLMGKFLSVFRMVEFCWIISPCQAMVPFWNGPANNDFENFYPHGLQNFIHQFNWRSPKILGQPVDKSPGRHDPAVLQSVVASAHFLVERAPPFPHHALLTAPWNGQLSTSVQQVRHQFVFFQTVSSQRSWSQHSFFSIFWCDWVGTIKASPILPKTYV